MSASCLQIVITALNISLLFMYLQRIREMSAKHSHNAAVAGCNTSKNRWVDILPCKIHFLSCSLILIYADRTNRLLLLLLLLLIMAILIINYH